MSNVEANPVTASGETNPPHAPARPELLAPAGDWECAKAAVENGADAIYFGLERFNARMRAQNFTEADLPRLMEFLHRRGVKGYVTFNTLVFADEMAVAEQFLRAIIAAGVDAAIVQDVGICRLIRRLSPDFPIHASTQMTVTSAGGVEFARELGCNLVVLARECSIKEIEKIQAAAGHDEAANKERANVPLTPTLSPSDRARETEVVPLEVSDVAGNKKRANVPLTSAFAGLRRDKPALSPSDGAREMGAMPGAQLPLEVFVHGALCVAYSGQCLTSEALGGRSANRGECAQACRMPYELISDGKIVSLGDRRYLLSPQDLAGLDVLPELVRAGVASLKIEGRLKTPEYVANITRMYRQALDDLRFTIFDLRGSGEIGDERGGRSTGKSPIADSRIAGTTATGSESAKIQTARKSEIENRKYDVEMAFSRGLYTGWFRGNDNQKLVHARFGKKRGVYLGEVRRVHGERVALELAGPLKPGDGVVFDAGHPDQDEEGGRVYTVETRGRETLLGFGHGDVDFGRIHAGDKLWKTSDPELDRRLRQSFAGEKPQFQRPLHLEVHGSAGRAMSLIAHDEVGHVARVDSAMPLAVAEKQPLSTEKLREQLGRLGGTPFELGGLDNHLTGAVMLPVSELNRLRREVVGQLEALRAKPKRWGMETAENSRFQLPRTEDSQAENLRFQLPELIVLVRDLAQLEMALECGVQTLYCEFEDPKKYRDAVIRFRSSQFHTPQSAIFVAPPRIFKTGEDWILKQVRSCEADGYLIRNYDHLNFFADCRRVGDYSLNVANGLTADYFKNQFALERVTASYDLNFTQLEALLKSAPPEWFEITLHQHIPMFHMEHCVFCAFLSKGTDYTNCGRPCDTHEVKLRDRVGAEHPLKADIGCRNTVFQSLAQTGAEYAARMLALGARHFRIEFLNETPEQVKQTITKYRQLLRGEIDGSKLWRELKLLNQLGVTRGQMAG